MFWRRLVADTSRSLALTAVCIPGDNDVTVWLNGREKDEQGDLVLKFRSEHRVPAEATDSAEWVKEVLIAVIEQL